MKGLKHSEVLVGVKAIYRNGDLIYRDAASFPDEMPERSIVYDEKKYTGMDTKEDMLKFK